MRTRIEGVLQRSGNANSHRRRSANVNQALHVHTGAQVCRLWFHKKVIRGTVFTLFHMKSKQTRTGAFAARRRGAKGGGAAGIACSLAWRQAASACLGRRGGRCRSGMRHSRRFRRASAACTHAHAHTHTRRLISTGIIQALQATTCRDKEVGGQAGTWAYMEGNLHTEAP
jgi:hypothetical protein